MTGAELRLVLGQERHRPDRREVDRAARVRRGAWHDRAVDRSPVLKCVLPDAPGVDARFQQDMFGARFTFDVSAAAGAARVEIAGRTGARDHSRLLVLAHGRSGALFRSGRRQRFAIWPIWLRSTTSSSASRTSTPATSARARKPGACSTRSITPRSGRSGIRPTPSSPARFRSRRGTPACPRTASRTSTPKTVDVQNHAPIWGPARGDGRRLARSAGGARPRRLPRRGQPRDSLDGSPR